MDVPARLRRRRLADVPGLILLLLLAACETNVDPFPEHDLAFTVFGYLESGADTQFVRITPLRRHLYTGQTPLDAVVSIEHVASGATTTMHDSLFAYAFDLFAHNYWTSFPVRAGETYRLTLQQADRSATVTIPVPPDFPDPIVEEPQYLTRYVRIRGIERLVAAELAFVVVNTFTGARSMHRFDCMDRVSPAPDGFVFGFRQGELLPQIGTAYVVEAAFVTVAAGSPDWPDAAGLDIERLALPQTFDNVEGGLGYVGGVTTKTVQWL